MDDKNAAEIMRLLGKLDERTENIEKEVCGNGQPGLKQKVEALEEHKNKMVGAMGVIGIIGGSIWGFLEYIFHFKGGK